MVLRDAKGNQIQATNPTAAPRIDFNPTADGDYNLSVEHLLFNFGPSETYRVTIKPPEPGFDLTLAMDRFDVARRHSQHPGAGCAARLHRADRTVRRRAAGVERHVISCCQPASGESTRCAAVEGCRHDSGWSLCVRGEGHGDDRRQTRPVVTATTRVPVSLSQANLPIPPQSTFNYVALAVTERAPFKLVAKFDEAAAAPGKPTTLTVTVTRIAGFNGDVALTATGLPGNVTAKPISIPANMTEAKLTLTLAANAAVGTFPISINGKAKHNTRDFSVNSDPATLTVKK